jgi:hypothetical protein
MISIRSFLLEWRYTHLVLGVGTLTTLTAFNYLSGAFNPDNILWYLDSQRAYLGQVLMLIILPAYIFFVFVHGVRRSYEIALQLDVTHGTDLKNTVAEFPVKLVVLAGIAGFLYAVLFNVPGNALNFFSTDATERALIMGQVFVWSIVGALIAVRARVALAFNRAGEVVSFEILEPSSLRPFAMIGLVDVLVIAGGLVLSTVQSLDMSFRPDNYSKALIVVIPAMLYLLIYPMWGLHKRMRQNKLDQLNDLNVRILAASKQLETDDMNKLELLLQRRERVAQASTWPIDMAIVQRFLFYIVIPPLAWVGAALVEFVIDGIIQNP